MSLMARLVEVSGADLVSSNVSSTADDYSATEPYVTDEEANYGDRVYVALQGTTFPVAQSSIQTATPGDAIWHGGQLEIGDTVAFTSSNTLPTGISANTLYYVKESDTPSLPFTTWFSVSTTQGGSSVNITGTGTGTLTVHRNPVFGVTPGTDDTKWLDSRPTNEWAMFDQFTLTKTSNASSIAVTVAPGGRFDVIGLLGLANVSLARIAAYTTGGSGNLLTQTEVFDNAAWTKLNSSISANAIAGPTGASTADQLIEDGTVNQHGVNRAGVTVTAAAHTLSIYVKNNGRRYFILRANDNATNANAASIVVDTTDGSIAGAATAYGDFTAVSGSVEDVAGGWYRVSLTFTPATTTISVKNEMSDVATRSADGQSSSYDGDTTSGMYLWGAQLKAGSSAGDYVEITTTAQKTYHYIKGYDLTETAFADDWYAGTYAEAVYKDRLAVSDIPPSSASAVALVTLTGSGTLECGSCLFGLSKDIGDAQYGAQVGIDNWTRLERDDFGGIQIDATRGYSDNAEYEAWFEKAKAGALRKLFADYKDTPALYLMAPDAAQPGGWDAIGIHHAIASFRTTLNYPSHYTCRLDFEGMT